jgi:uncharacterized protein (TIGR02453 family)
MSTTWIHDAARFFTELDAHNDREWWLANRAVYDTVIKPSFVELLDDLDSFGSWRLYRPHNNRRFATDTPPYKTFIGAVAEREDGVGAFVQVGPRGLMVGTGIPMPAPDQLTRLRAAIADEPSGPAFHEAVETVRSRGASVFGGRWEPLKRVPRGHSPAHPRAEYLRWKGVEVNHRPGLSDRPAAPLSSSVDALIESGEPINGWLGRHVGASALTAEERFAPKTARTRTGTAHSPGR